MYAIKKTLAMAFILFTLPAISQNLTQTIRGTVLDNVSKSTLPGATVILLGSEPLIGTTSDGEGNFKLAKVPIGTHTLQISFVGYKQLTLPNIVVNSGKEVVINAPIEEDITMMEAVVITPEIEKNNPLNDMATVSARTFSVEETRKYAAAVNDPARMVASYAGVVQTSDGNNGISIRGNSPYGLQWRMEGVEIPNPNHFSNVGTSGGGISILSSQLLTNSDFLTSAFPAEYGNALSGVFDLNLRKGNNEKREYTVQAGLLGVDFAAEGPLSKNSKGSYLVNYRYSTLSILNAMGLDLTDGVLNFQDLSFNIHLPTAKAGSFSWFGFGGLSNQTTKAIQDSLQWKENSFDRYNSVYFTNTGATGLKHAITLSAKTYVQSAIVLSGNDSGYDQEKLDERYVPFRDLKMNFVNKKITLSSVLNHKFNARHSIRSGFYLNEYFFNLRQLDFNEETKIMEQPLAAKGNASLVQAFSQWNYRINQNTTLNSGLHLLYQPSNNSTSVEPRLSLKYQLTEQQSISFGYGIHGQMLPVGVYEARVVQPDGNITQPNKNLGFNKSMHYVLAYDRVLSKYLRVKAETYYQHLYNIAVKNDINSPLSVNNHEEGYITDPLVNKGTGRNYGLELTVEQFLHNNLYFLLSSSLYDAKYKALDGVLRNSRYNGNFAFSFTAGKEFNLSNNRVAGINIRTLYSGGLRTTPIDAARSAAAGETKYIESLAYTNQLPNYFRTDFRFSIKKNRERFTSTLALDLQNATNRKNLGGEYYNPETGSVKKWYQVPLLPILSYKIEF